MEHMTIGECLASLEADTSKSALFAFPALKLTLVVRSIMPGQFLVTVTAPDEEPSAGILPTDKLGQLLAAMTEHDLSKAAAGLTDEAEAFLKAQASS